MGERAIPTGVTVFLEPPPTEKTYVIPINVFIMYAKIRNTIPDPYCVIRVSTVKALEDPNCPIRKGQEVYAVEAALSKPKLPPLFNDGTQDRFQTSF